MTKKATQAELRNITEQTRMRRESPRPFEESATVNLERKLASGALTEKVASQVRAELAHRAKTSN